MKKKPQILLSLLSFKSGQVPKYWHLKSHEFGVLFTYFSDRKVYSGDVFAQIHVDKRIAPQGSFRSSSEAEQRECVIEL